MYGLPGLKRQFGVLTKQPSRPRGRPSHKQKFLDRQRDLFPADLLLLHLADATKTGKR